jgi:hypothetical protein
MAFIFLYTEIQDRKVFLEEGGLAAPERDMPLPFWSLSKAINNNNFCRNS